MINLGNTKIGSIVGSKRTQRVNSLQRSMNLQKSNTRLLLNNIPSTAVYRQGKSNA